MLSSNQIVRSFHHQYYLFKECTDLLDFLHGDIYRGKVTYEATASGYVCSDMPSHAQTSLNLPRVPFRVVLGAFSD